MSALGMAKVVEEGDDAIHGFLPKFIVAVVYEIKKPLAGLFDKLAGYDPSGNNILRILVVTFPIHLRLLKNSSASEPPEVSVVPLVIFRERGVRPYSFAMSRY